MRSRWKVSLAMGCMGLILASRGFSYVLTGHDWTYQVTPMGENWIVCGTGVPGSGVQRTKDSASGWNYENFNFTFGADACLIRWRLSTVQQCQPGRLWRWPRNRCAGINH